MDWVDGWKPIEIAPMDGTTILIHHPEWEVPLAAGWNDGTEFWEFERGALRVTRTAHLTIPFNQPPTHWDWLPLPPKGEQK